jgi:hypothetical protein
VSFDLARWPIWRLLIAIEPWLLTVAVVHRYRPIHEQFLIPLLVAVIPAGVVVAMWALSRRATDRKPAGNERASLIELLIAATAAIAAAGWIVTWAIEAHADLTRIDAMFGRATVIVDVSLTWLSIAACFAALTLDGLISTAHQQLREVMKWLRRTHVTVTVVQVVALVGVAWLFTRLPDTGTAENIALTDRARVALYVYEYCRATVFPAQAFFAAMALAIAAADAYTD